MNIICNAMWNSAQAKIVTNKYNFGARSASASRAAQLQQINEFETDSESMSSATEENEDDEGHQNYSVEQDVSVLSVNSVKSNN